MNITPFEVSFIENGRYVNAEVRPCCNEDNVVDYAIWIKNKLAFTITKEEDSSSWIIAMRNADDIIEEITVQQIGKAIDQKNVGS